jgi:capsid protein
MAKSWKSFLGSFFNFGKKPEAKLEDWIRAYNYYDAAYPSESNVQNWGHVQPETVEDITDPDSIQRLRITSLYETINDDALNGMVAVAAESIVGRGPKARIQIGIKQNKKYRETEQLIEYYWNRWFDDVNYAEKLRTAQKDLQQYGTYFRRIVYNPLTFQSLDVQLISPLRVANPGGVFNADMVSIEGNIFKVFNGIAFDEYRNERYYCVIDRPLFQNGFYDNMSYTWVDAALMSHIFDPQFSEQVDGHPMTTPSLEKGVMRRLYEKDELRAARLAATLTGCFKTTADFKAMFELLTPKDASLLTSQIMSSQKNVGEFKELPISNFLNLPPGTEAQAFDLQHPHSGFVPYRQESLKGQGRSLRMPEFVALGSCAAYNYASVQKDSQWWDNHRDVFRQQMELKDLRKTFRRWFSIASYEIPKLAKLREKIESDDAMEVQLHLYWKQEEHADPLKQVQAEALKVRSGFKPLSDVIMSEGKDPEQQMEKIKEEMDFMEGYAMFDEGMQIPVPELPVAGAMGAAPAATPKPAAKKAGIKANADEGLTGDCDGTFDIEATEGKLPKIKAEPAYSGGLLQVNWTPASGVKLPVVVDLLTLEAKAGTPFLLNHKINEPVGVIEDIVCSDNSLKVSGTFTHVDEDYGKREIINSKRGFKHRPSIGIYNPTEDQVTYVARGQSLYANGQLRPGPFYFVRHGRLKEVSLVTVPADLNADPTGMILAKVGENTMPDTGTPAVEPTVTPTPTPPPVNPTPPVQPTVPPANTEPAPAVGGDPSKPIQASVDTAPAVHTNYHSVIEKMYEKNELSAGIMASAIENNWTPSQALTAQAAVKGDLKPAGFPQGVTPSKKNEPNNDYAIAAAYLQAHCDFSADDVKKEIKIDDRSLDLSTTDRMRQVRFSDICAHAVQSYFGEQGMPRFGLYSARPMELYQKAVEVQTEIDRKYSYDPSDIRADVDTGVSTIGLKNIWTLINNATIGRGYKLVPTSWQKICAKGSVSNFLTHEVHRTQMLGEFQPLDEVGQEPPHLTYAETMTSTKIRDWGAMLAFGRKDIINDEVGVFTNAASELGKKCAITLDRQCFITLLRLGPQVFKTQNKNVLSGTGSAFSFEAMDKAWTLIRTQKDEFDQAIDLRPSYLLIPSTMAISVENLLSMGTLDGSEKGVQNRYKAFRDGIVETQLLTYDNGLSSKVGSNVTKYAGSDKAWYMLTAPSDAALITATFLNGKETPTTERGNMRFTLDGVQYKSIIDFDFVISDHRGAVKAIGE